MLYKNKGITLVALVITIVILIILATISISAIFGDNGLITSAQKARKEQEKAEARERLELVLADAFTEKKVTEKYTEEEFLENHLEEFVYEREKDAEIFNEDGQDLISLNGHVFELDRSVPQLGEWVGEKGNLLPAIRSIKVTSKTDTSATIEVTTARGEGTKFRYAIKKADEGDESYTQVTEKSENTNEFTGLENTGAYTIYKAKVELLKDGKVVDTETIDILIGKLEKGVVRFEDGKWENGKASVKILTDEKGYTLQYQIGGIDDNSWINTTSGSTISGLKLNETVYGRLWDGINESDPASFEVKDDVDPKVTVTSQENKTDSINIKVAAVDNESGMTETVTYKYYIKETNQGDESYVQKGTNTTGNFTFDKLTQGTSYDIKVEVTGDKAGNIGIGYLNNQTTGSLPGGEEGLEQGAIKFSDPVWSAGKAKITISTNTDLQIQYQKNTTDGNWLEITNGGEVTELEHNNTVYARLTDGTNYGEYASVTIKDEIDPTITEIKEIEVTENTIKIQVTATDNESGIAKIEYSKDDGASYVTGTTATATEYTFEELTESTEYTVKVRVTDGAGNTAELSKKITTNGEKFSEIYDKTTEYTDSEGNTAWIPGGFAVGIDEGINKINDGLVIKDAKGNQFVWIPVEDYTTMYEEVTESITLSGVTTTTNVYSKLRVRSGDNYSPTKPGTTSEIREPDLVTSYDTQSQYYSVIASSAQNMADKMVAEYKATYESIKHYKGFYIGRFELTGTVSSPTVQKGRVLTSGIAGNWYYLKRACTNVVSTKYAQTTMVYGNQWDEVCSWLKTKGYNTDTNSASWGNYANSTGAADIEGHGSPQITGYSKAWSAQNIYDLAGNYWEWTQEASYTSRRGSRGGNYDNFNNSGSNSPASCRNIYLPHDYGNRSSSRPALYVALSDDN